jgi:hypothetical protein
MNVFPVLTLSVSITASDTEVCDGDSVLFTAYPVNGGFMPIYQWTNHGIDIPGATDLTYHYVPADGDDIRFVLTSIEPCKTNNPATSDAITMIVHPVLAVSVTISADTTEVCEGGTVYFTAYPVNPGTTPAYQWKVNGGDVIGASNSTFSVVPSDGDEITCVLTSSETVCTTGNPATSNIVGLTVYQVLPVSLTIAASSNPVLRGTPVTFTATAVNEGDSPKYKWVVNGNFVGAESPSYTFVPLNGDKVFCVMLSSLPCASGNPAFSDTIVMNVLSVPVALYIEDVTIYENESVCFDAVSFIRVAGSPYKFTVESGGSVTMIAGQRIRILDGTRIFPGGYLHGYISTDFCPIIPDAPIGATISGQDETPFMSENANFKVYPNPTNGNFSVEMKGNADFAGIRVEVYGMRGERMLTEKIVGEKKHEFMFSDVPAGLYFVKIIAGDHVETIKLIKNQ